MDRRLWVLCPAMVVPGLTMILPGATLDAAMSRFGVDKVSAGFISSAIFGGAAAGMLITSGMMARGGARRSLALCLAASAVCEAAFAVVSNYLILLGLFVALGVSFGVLVTLPGVVISSISGKDSAGPMNFVYGFFALGVVIGPLEAGWMLNRGWPWWSPWLVPAAVGLIASLGAYLIAFEEPPLQSALSIALVKEIWRENSAVMTVGVFGIMLYVASEATLNFWIPKFLLDTFPLNTSIYGANVVLTLFWTGLAVGRWAYKPIAGALNPAKFVIIVSLLCALLVGISPHFEGRLLAKGGLALSGLLYAALYPTIVSYTGRLKPGHSGAAFSVMAMAGQAGPVFLPPIVGAIANAGKFPLAMSLAAVPLALLATLFFIANSKRKI